MAISLSDILTTAQQGVTATNALVKQAQGSFTSIAAQLATLQSCGTGNVTGPSSATANGFAVYNGTTGKIIKDHPATVSLTSEVTGTLPTANGGLGNTAGAWTVWNPTIVPQSGAFTTSSATGGFYTIGKLVHFAVTLTITTVGTASGSMSIALPTGTAARPSTVVVSESVTTGNIGFGRILSGGTTVAVILKYDNTTYIGAGNVVTLTGIYEQT